ncbi:hypothetical protein [Methanolapillus millepedarum]|uniref:Uncharacterized protein n=1 Tax=Methanolapillus millepedarum TaxID=3028296 RepID=A0AA96ZUB4_9EURY|nr:hypothetical protein MsAc7_10870 [Methanosarcinaceae archaeon Ac7]
MPQTEIAMEAYNALWAAGYVPHSSYVWMIFIIIIGIIALYQARTFISKF